ncbi:MAG: nucleoside-diphosphate sugar epimerase/dehydratase, partial [Phycisphaerales bacterium JB059]
DRIRRVLDELASAPVLIHGAGAHTLALRDAIGATPTVVAISDDNPELAGRRVLGLPVVEPKDAATTGATDVVISSWLHEEAIWSRREVFERQGLRVHRLYTD